MPANEPKRTRDPFRNMSNDAARVKYTSNASAKPAKSKHKGLDARVLTASVAISHLSGDDEQREAYERIHADGSSVITSMFAQNDIEQTAAVTALRALNLEAAQLEETGSRWSVRWSNTIEKSGLKCVLYQCQCGYDHTLHSSKTRQTPWPFTGCLAHVEVTYWVTTGQVLRIRAYSEHNTACSEASLLRRPNVPLHPSVFDVALRQLQLGASLTEIQEQNRRMFAQRLYPDQPADLAESAYRWLILRHDTRTLYRRHAHLNGIDVAERAEINIDEWLDPTSPKHNKVLSGAIFHYSARATRGDRFEVCIANHDMQEAAWRYAHGRQLILDGTFGVCNARILVFIAMAIDEENKGVPIAFLLFSAPAGNKLSSSGYDTAILTRLLVAWNRALGTRNGEAFKPRVAMTDTDFKERAALLVPWPELWELICRFHLRQCWRNHRAIGLKGDVPGIADVRMRLQDLEVALVETTHYPDAQELVRAERRRLQARRSSEQAAARKGLVHLDYLEGYWLKEELWQSWSDYGRQRAATPSGRGGGDNCGLACAW
ncbi:hypothetical protein EXIGLDRAFT_139730 [Exidia glandulosa HHB12029]|uniref:MULE transposase domain-containing protein n=1 Tax=Exidia glandulosa HHB12029 TaxID=1314781 RepID=A0A165FWK6_EXIGL|nr:hypothetical protein EXIGLDRAFT_139730 [Exidia glandulosa HHB12029]